MEHGIFKAIKFVRTEFCPELAKIKAAQVLLVSLPQEAARSTFLPIIESYRLGTIYTLTFYFSLVDIKIYRNT